MLMLSLREKLGCCVWLRVLLVVLCDHLLMLLMLLLLPAPSRKAPMPSAAPLAALERRLEAVGGGVARVVLVWGAASGCFASLSLSEATLFTVTTEDDESDVLCEWVRWWAGAGSCCVVGAAGGRECMFMLASEPAESWCLRATATSMQRGCRHAAGAGTRSTAGDDAGMRGRSLLLAAVRVCCVSSSVVMCTDPYET